MTDDQFKTLLKEVHAMRQSLYEVRQELAEQKLTNKRDHEFFREQMALVYQRLKPDIEVLSTDELTRRLGFDPGITNSPIKIKP